MNINRVVLFCWLLSVLLLCGVAFYCGKRSAYGQIALKIDEKSSSPDTAVEGQGVVEEAEIESIPGESVHKVPEEVAENEEKVVPILESDQERTRIRPERFSKFRATFEVLTKDPKEPEYAQKQAKELRSLVKTIPSVEDVLVIRIDGVEGEETFEIPVDF